MIGQGAVKVNSPPGRKTEKEILVITGFASLHAQISENDCAGKVGN